MSSRDGTLLDKSRFQSQLNDVRIIGHLLVHGPSETAKASIVKVVLDTLTSSYYRRYVEENLHIAEICFRMVAPLGGFLDKFLIRPCKSGIVYMFSMAPSLNDWSVNRIGDELLSPAMIHRQLLLKCMREIQRTYCCKTRRISRRPKILYIPFRAMDTVFYAESFIAGTHP
jgi:hypothetical protein